MTDAPILEEILGRLVSEGSPDQAARSLGLRSRFALSRFCHVVGLPAPRTAKRWFLVIRWTEQYARERTPLARQALAGGHDPAWAYRLVRTMTGRNWSEVRRLGPGWLRDRVRAIRKAG